MAGQARILDPGTFVTITVLPNMPGSVTSFEAGRTYPMEGEAYTWSHMTSHVFTLSAFVGAALLLPQYPPYTDPVTVLICGGSNFGVALDNCISIQPEVNNATWSLERMVGCI